MVIANTELPTTTKLGISISDVDGINVQEVAQQWLDSFSQAASKGIPEKVLSLLADDAWWRDLLAMTWDLRSFQGRDQIKKFLEDRLAAAKLTNFQLSLTGLDKPWQDLVWLRGHYTFETERGNGTGIFRLIPSKSASGQLEWKCHSILTNLDSLKGFPEAIGSLWSFAPNHGKWLEQRRRELEFVDQAPEVLIIGGGQSGLEVAARLKMLGVRSLVCEKRARIGDQWRHRYAALCLNNPVWYDHMPYLPFPPNWPVFCPAPKLADWLESYAQAMELNVWTSASVVDAKQEVSGKWLVTIQRDNTSRVFHVDHVVFAIGVGGGTPNMPKIQEWYGTTFKGQILHSAQHNKATDHAGKKVVVIGACTSAHDICADYAEQGIDVTMWQRSATYIVSLRKGLTRLMTSYWEGSPPNEISDLIDASLPVLCRKMLDQRLTTELAELDRETLDGLRKVGFQLSRGIDDSGLTILALEKLSGYYIDAGASQMIIDGKIKLKSNSGGVKHFTEDGLIADDGSEIKADVVLFATGYGDPRDPIRTIVGEEVGAKIAPVWGLDSEGEVRSVWKEVGVPNLWIMMGNFAWCRFYSKHLALQIKAKQAGIFGTRYSATGGQ